MLKSVKQIRRERSKGAAGRRLWWILRDLQHPNGDQIPFGKLSSNSQINYGKSDLPCVIQEVNMKNVGGVFLLIH